MVPTPPAAAPPRALFLVSTPLHSFWTLGLLQGPFAGWRAALAIVDQVAIDPIAEALAARGEVDVRRFERLGARAQARAVLHELAAWTRQWDPSYIAAGNDRRIEFHAAVHACPQARRGYVEDGLFSYAGHKDMRAGRLGRWQRRLSGWRRSLAYGFPVEKPRLVGGSDAVQEGWVLLPQEVHGGLAGKPVHAIEPAWFATPAAHETCLQAAALTGFDAGVCDELRAVLLLPHGTFLAAHPTIRARLEAVVAAQVDAGRRVAVKCHPSTEGMPIALPPRGWLEIPRRLPIETLAPLLHDALVVGTLTTALLSLQLLGRRLEVRSLAPPSEAAAADRAYHDRASRIYAGVGITPLD